MISHWLKHTLARNLLPSWRFFDQAGASIVILVLKNGNWEPLFSEAQLCKTGVFLNADRHLIHWLFSAVERWLNEKNEEQKRLLHLEIQKVVFYFSGSSDFALEVNGLPI